MNIEQKYYLLDEFISVRANIVHSVPMYGEVGLKRLVLLQQALRPLGHRGENGQKCAWR